MYMNKCLLTVVRCYKINDFFIDMLKKTCYSNLYQKTNATRKRSKQWILSESYDKVRHSR